MKKMFVHIIIKVLHTLLFYCIYQSYSIITTIVKTIQFNENKERKKERKAHYMIN